MVHVIFCSACTYWKKTENSAGCSMGSPTCCVKAIFLCQCLFLMPCWLCWARNATFPVVVGTRWHCLFHVFWRTLEGGFSGGLCVPWSGLCHLAYGPEDFTGGKVLLVCQLVGPIVVLSGSYAGYQNVLIWTWLSFGWNLWFGQSYIICPKR